MWCNSYGLTVPNLTATKWILGTLDSISTLKLDMDKIDGRLFYGTFLNEISLMSGTVITNLYSTNSSGDTNYLRCTTLNIHEGAKIYGNYSYKPLIDVTTLNIYGGEIFGNVCIGMWAGITTINLNMYGGSIHGNYQTKPHGSYTNANDPQSVAFTTSNNVSIYDGEIRGNFVGLGHDNEARGTVAGIGTRSSLQLYIKNGAIDENVLVVVDQFGEFALDANGCYTCVIDPVNYRYVTDNGDGTFTYERQYNRHTLHAYDYSVIFKYADSSVINSYMINGDGNIVKSLDGSETVAIPSNIINWSATVNDCKPVTVVTNAQGTYYVSVDHTVSDEKDCTKGIVCDKCETVISEPQPNHKLNVTIAYENNNFAKSGVKTEVCQNTDCEYSVTSNTPALFSFAGYSTNRDNTEMCASYTVNKVAIAEYTKCNEGITFKYGLVATADTSNLEVLKLNNGIVESNVEKAIVVEISDEYAGFDFRLSGFKNPQNADEKDTKNIEIVLCTYVVVNQDIYYLGSANDYEYCGKTATALTYYTISDEEPTTFE